MIQIGYTVKFVMAQRLISDHRKIQKTEESQKFLHSLAKVDLLIIDEFGYLPHDKEAGQ
jgi:DNA replication protein DnaC